jgi:SAM-dependent methyltransferase
MGCFNSEILYGLDALGYRALAGCDLNPMCRWMPRWDRIKYRVVDLTKTPYSDASFGAITCLSVIEHGVPLGSFVQEVARLLRPGGVFVFTTDYDATRHEHAIDDSFRLFGQSWRIFTPEALTELIGAFEDLGLELLDPGRIDRRHAECPIDWNGQSYTFVMVGLRKPVEAGR